jgi:hypothetical protein
MAVKNFNPELRNEDSNKPQSKFDQTYSIQDSNIFNDIIVYTLTDFLHILDEFFLFEYDHGVT